MGPVIGIIISVIIYLIILILLFNISGHLKDAGKKLNNSSLSRAGRNFEWIAIIQLIIIICSATILIFVSVYGVPRFLN